MANSKDSAGNHKYATVDTVPDGDGYFTDEVCPRDLQKSQKVGKVYFSIREAVADISAAPSSASVITVQLQFRCPGDSGWSNYVPLDASSLAIGNRVALEDSGRDVIWRAGVASDEYTSGAITFGFDW